MSPIIFDFLICSIILRLGDRDLSSIRDDFGAAIRHVRRTHVHPKYEASPTTAYFDVALWEVTPKISFNSYIRPLCLPPEPYNDLDKYEGHAATVTG